MLTDLKERLAKFKLALQEEKTLLIEFGKLSSELRRKRGARRCEKFKFLGLMHYWAWSRDGCFVVKRRTDHKRLTRKLKGLRTQERRRMHTPVVLQYQWLCSVLRGHYAYFGLPSNFDRIHAFYQATRRLWYRAHSVARTPSSAPISSILDWCPLADSNNLRRSRVRESQMLGSARAKAEWLALVHSSKLHQCRMAELLDITLRRNRIAGCLSPRLKEKSRI